jgi:hypothetical protein
MKIRVLQVLIGTMSIRLSKDNHDTWVTCTTSAEWKTVITVALTVMSGIYPHMISGNLGWVMVKSWVGLGWVVSKWALLGCGLVTVKLRGTIKIVSLKR